MTIKETKGKVPIVLINRENTKSSGYDFTNDFRRLFMQGDCDDVVK